VTGSKPIIFLAVGNEIRKFISDSKYYDYEDLLFAGRRIQGLAIDADKRMIYWTDSMDRVIRRALIPYDAKEPAHPQVLDIKVRPLLLSGIAIDWVAK
jgi:hypothetical protein